MSDNAEKLKLVLKWITQSREPFPWYQHEELGFNYRLSNICAGIGLGQMSVLEDHVNQKTNIYNKYKNAFKDLPVTMHPSLKDTKPNHWLSALTINKDCNLSPFAVMDKLKEYNVETRPIWKPMHMQPIYRLNPFINKDGINRAKTNAYIKGETQDIGMDIFNRGLCLPSDNKMTVEQQDRIIEVIRSCFE